MQQDYVLVLVSVLPQSTLRKIHVQPLYFRVDQASLQVSIRVCGPILKERFYLPSQKDFNHLRRGLLLCKILVLSIPFEQDMIILVVYLYNEILNQTYPIKPRVSIRLFSFWSLFYWTCIT